MLICTLTSIAETVGANRIYPAKGIPHPLGDPKIPADEEKQLRKRMVAEAIRLLSDPCTMPDATKKDKNNGD